MPLPPPPDSQYASDWSIGETLGSIGIIWVGEIPLPTARDLVAAGWDVVGAPLPPPDVAQPPPDVAQPPRGDSAPPTDLGGPEETAPPQFDQPLPQEAPPVNAPALPPLEGEYIPAAPSEPPPMEPQPPIEGQYDVFGPRNPYDWRKARRTAAKRERIFGPNPANKRPPPLPERPPPADIPEMPRLPRLPLPRIPGPASVIIDAILNPTVPGSGELPFPPIPRVEIPPPTVALPEPTFPELQPPAPELNSPPVPDVVVVEAPAPTAPAFPKPAWQIPRSAQIGIGLGGLLAPILRRFRRPGSPNLQNFLQNQPQPLAPPDPLSPPPPMPGTDPLTPTNTNLLPSPQPAGSMMPPPTPPATSEDQCHCQKCKRCDDRKRRKQLLSNKRASVQPFTRRMSVYSLKNLKRGGIKVKKR